MTIDRRIAFAAFILAAVACNNARAQTALPGIPGLARGSLGCQYNTVAPTLINGQASPFQCNSAGDLFTAPTQGGSPLSTTNGGYTNVLQGNAVLSSTNPIFAQLTTGAAAIGTVNPTTAGNWAIGTLNSTLPSVAQFGGAQARSSEISAVTSGNETGIVADLVGRQIIFPFANKENLVAGNTSVTGTTSTSLISAPGSSNYIYVTHFSCMNSGSSGTTVSLQNGSGGTTIWEGYAAASGGGFVATFPTPIGGVEGMTSNTALFFAAGTATTTLYCNASGFKGT